MPPHPPSGDAISSRQSIEASLSRSESLLRLAGSVAKVAGWTIELPGDEIFWSQEMFTILDCSATAPSTLSIDATLGFYPPEHRDRLRKALEGCARYGEGIDVRVQTTSFTGRPIWLRIVGEAERAEGGTIMRVHGAVQDVTADHETARQAERLAQQLTTTLGSITDAFYTLDTDWRFTYINDEAEKLLRRDRAVLLGRSVWEEFPRLKKIGIYDAALRAVGERVTLTLDDCYFHLTNKCVEFRIYPSEQGVAVYVRDVTERRLAERERERLLVEAESARAAAQQAKVALEQLAAHDRLTGFYNRREIARRIDEMTGPIHVLCIGLDRFKEINDWLGHVVGDQLLVEVARRLSIVTGPADTLARTGGDEFIVLTDGSMHSADLLAEQILEALRQPTLIAGQRIHITASVGLATSGGDRCGDLALRDADAALYRAKATGRDGSAHFDEAARHQVAERRQMANELRDALATDELRLHYQPMYDAVSGIVVGAEALVRWQHPERGLVPPGAFIGVAEATGLIGPLGEWCLRTAIATAARWVTPDRHFVMWVNVSLRQLTRPGLADTIASLLEEAEVDAAHLGIEVTESAFTDDSEILITEMLALSNMGIQIAIDDFGTGYSSLARLAALPVDILKIDRSFVNNVGTRSGAATVSAIIDLAHAVDVEVVAEGIETAEQLDALVTSGCDTVSGFLLGRPAPAHEVEPIIAAGVRRHRTSGILQA